MKFFKFLIGLPAALFLFSACHDEPAPEPPEPVSEVRRTVLVYMVSDNNLGQSGFDFDDIIEMQKAARQGDIPADGRMLVYNDGYNRKPVLFEVKAAGNDTLMCYDSDELSVSASRMAKVLDDCKTVAPALSRGLVLWSHGSGWIEDGIDEPQSPRERSFGYQNRQTMNVSTMARVIEEADGFDFIYFDCCYMHSVEALYELRNCTPVFAGSATELLTSGMPYQQNVAEFFKAGDADLVAAATNTFNLYNAKMGMDRTCTMSVVRSAGLEPLAQATAAIYARCGIGMPSGYKPQCFSNVSVASCNYFDFYDYVHALCFADGTERFDGAAEAFANFQEQFDNTVIYSAATPYLWSVIPLNRHHGLSTYIIADADHLATKNYTNLEWFADVASKLKTE